jgi:hypothetical protein
MVRGGVTSRLLDFCALRAKDTLKKSLSKKEVETSGDQSEFTARGVDQCPSRGSNVRVGDAYRPRRTGLFVLFQLLVVVNRRWLSFQRLDRCQPLWTGTTFGYCFNYSIVIN